MPLRMGPASAPMVVDPSPRLAVTTGWSRRCSPSASPKRGSSPGSTHAQGDRLVPSHPCPGPPRPRHGRRPTPVARLLEPYLSLQSTGVALSIVSIRTPDPIPTKGTVTWARPRERIANSDSLWTDQRVRIRRRRRRRPAVQIEDVIGSDLEDEDFSDGADGVVIWYRDGDDDLVDLLVDALTKLFDAGFIVLFTPKAGRPGHVEASDVEEAASTAGADDRWPGQRGLGMGRCGSSSA